MEYLCVLHFVFYCYVLSCKLNWLKTIESYTNRPNWIPTLHHSIRSNQTKLVYHFFCWQVSLCLDYIILASIISIKYIYLYIYYLYLSNFIFPYYYLKNIISRSQFWKRFFTMLNLLKVIRFSPLGTDLSWVICKQTNSYWFTDTNLGIVKL